MNPPYTVAQVLADLGPILLDFDGPVCAVFAALPDHAVAERLRHVLRTHHVQATSDPLDVLHFTATIGSPDLTIEVEDELCAAELTAVDGALRPSGHRRRLPGRPPNHHLRNNFTDAIKRYLNAHLLTRYITAVVGRTHADSMRIKPNPEPILNAVQAIKAEPPACVIIGDSVSDVEGERAAGVRTIGFANKPDKRAPLVAAGADAITEGANGMLKLAMTLSTEVANS